MQPSQVTVTHEGRRAFLRNGALVLMAAGVEPATALGGIREEQPAVKCGLVTDLHYADKQPAGSRHYRETPDKLAEAAEHFGSSELDFVVELGDFIDAADSVEQELAYLKRIDRDFSRICRKRHYVLGNHCVFTLRKQEFLAAVEQQRSYYSFDSGGFHFVVLDACFRHDGVPYGRKNFEWTDPNISAEELEWLRGDLQATSKRSVVFVHQRLDVQNAFGIKNAAEVRGVFEEAGNVLAVFQGHNHENDHQLISGIHYCTLVAMVEGAGAEHNGYSVAHIMSSGDIHISGFRKQRSYKWPS